ncbi:glycosyltransferase family 2 protein [Paracoccus stylophorae]|uniref:Glycosyltransferase family 2 protein n=1 Tax=Paracoccus stylophorae TaxID=659350 RepID=A0ABY7SUH7_9RHOB|nr:glycosyltransferase family 2 protein [Paracoccus stylophorae]WCR10685.1 glycosyltransferase family 2 protein [Paracoccus stylophorae]
MSRALDKDIAIVIPARNEARRIGVALRALAGQSPDRVRVFVMINNTTDATARVARRQAARCGLDLTIVQRSLDPGEGVGAARRIGCAAALRGMPGLRHILNTDADCIAAPDWVARNLAHLQRADAVCGRIEPISSEAEVLAQMDPVAARNEGIYAALVREFHARHAPHCAHLGGTHGQAAGASLAVTRAAYLAAGGFAPQPCGEDRDLVRRLGQTRRRIVHADDVIVQASCRLTGRAQGGMSDALRWRVAGGDYLVDDGLPRADTLLSALKTGTLGAWPPLVSGQDRLLASELPRHIDMLSAWLNDGHMPAGPPCSESSAAGSPSRAFATAAKG